MFNEKNHAELSTPTGVSPHGDCSVNELLCVNNPPLTAHVHLTVTSNNPPSSTSPGTSRSTSPRGDYPDDGLR